MTHDPKNLYRRLACAAEEARGVSGAAFLDAFDRALDDVRLAGFPELAKGLGAIVSAARQEEIDTQEQIAEAQSEQNEAAKELDAALTRIEALEGDLRTSEEENESLSERVLELEATAKSEEEAA